MYNNVFILLLIGDLLSTCHLKRIVHATWKAREKWFDIGIALLNDIPTLNYIRTQYRCDPGECLREVFSHWLSSGQSTSQVLLSSVKSLPIQENFPDLDLELLDFFQDIKRCLVCYVWISLCL